jgi:hypothetical protein
MNNEEPTSHIFGREVAHKLAAIFANGIVNLFTLMQYRGKGEAVSLLYSLRQPGLES